MGGKRCTYGGGKGSYKCGSFTVRLRDVIDGGCIK